MAGSRNDITQASVHLLAQSGLPSTTPPPPVAQQSIGGAPSCNAFHEWSCHCKYVPILTSSTVLEELRQIEASYGVVLSVVDQFRDTTRIEQFMEIIRSVQGVPENGQLFKSNELGIFITTNTKRPYVWLVQQGGRMQALCQDSSDSLTKLYEPLTRKNFILDGKEFIADFDDTPSGKITEVLTGTVQKVERSPLWTHYRPEHQHFPNDISEAIEQIYHYGGPHIEIDGCNYTFDFNQMVLISVPNCEKVVIRRQEDPKLLPEPQITFQICGLNEAAVTTAKMVIQEKLDHALRSVIVTPPAYVGASSAQILAVDSLVLNNVRQYCVSTHPTASRGFQIKGAHDYTEKTTVLLMDQFRVLQAVMSSLFWPAPSSEMFQQLFPSAQNSEFPQEWEVQNESCEFKAVQQGTIEWDLVSNCMQESIPGVNIRKLERVQSVRLWEKFALEKKHMSIKNERKAKAANVSVVNEKLLFHGTRKIDPYVVAKSEKGFDLRRSREKLRFGIGSYFAEEASYSSQSYAYVTYPSCKQLLLARVLVGFSKDYGKQSQTNLVEAPVMCEETGGNVFKFDSVCGYIGSARVYAIYDWEKTYPAYIVTYRD